MTPEEFNLENFDMEEAKRQISADMASILKETPEAAPVLEEIAKLLAMAEDPDTYIKTESLTVLNVGTYELIAAPAAGMPGFSVLVRLELDNGKHDIGPAQVWHGNSMEDAIKAMQELKLLYSTTHQRSFKDCVTGVTYMEDGYFTPYDAKFPDLGPLGAELDGLALPMFDFDDEEEDE